MPLGKTDSMLDNQGPFLITFSGIDGAGKTTQIEHLSSQLEQQGLRVLRLSFWDDVVVWSRLRSGVGQQAANFYQSSQTTGEAFEAKNYKHIRKWYLTTARAGLYLPDIVRLRRLLRSQRLRDCDVVIFDRYVYDQFANIYSRSPITRAYIRALLKLTPSPDVAFIIDTPPAEAFARKPEYPLEFMYKNRRAFLDLRQFSPELIAIPTASIENVEEEILSHINGSRLAKIARRRKAQMNGEGRSSPAAEFL